MINHFNSMSIKIFWLSILHFHGRFVFQMPEYNNAPGGEGIKFDPNLDEDKVYENCGCDPASYYEFIFRNVKVSQATYRDCSSVTQGDSIIGQPVLLYGLMPDVSPSAIGAQLFAASMKVGNLLSGRLRKAVQSDLRTNVRPPNTSQLFSAESAGAHFETVLDLTDKTSPQESRFLSELGDITQLEFYMHVNNYTIWNTQLVGHSQDRLNGDVYGYIRPIVSVRDNNNIRIKARRLIAHPDIEKVSKELANTYLTSTPLTRNTDIDGTYDILSADRMLVLRYLDFIPLLDTDHTTPTDKGIVQKYVVFFVDKQTGNDFLKVGSFKGDHKEMQRTGGLFVSQLPVEVIERYNDLKLTVKVVKSGKEIPLMLESDWDLVLESQRGITIGSGNNAEVLARVYYQNKPWPDCPVRLLVQPSGEIPFLERKKNRRSPIVATWTSNSGESVSDANGLVKCTVQAINLENVHTELFDPVKNEYVKGELEWDRYYGNYIYIEIDNDLRKFQHTHVEQIEIPVRVLHTLEKPEVIASKNRITFTDYIFPKLLKYYVRYFPWIHTFQRANGTYRQFLDLEDYDQVSNRILEIIRRLELENDEWDKMPRSRDFPIGGADLIKYWLLKGMPK
jgi:hypothetical protein